MSIELLPALTVVGPLAIAAVLLISSHWLPRPVPDIVSLLAALAAVLSCVMMEKHVASAQPILYWFGGWAPRHGLPIGIGFLVDSVGALLGAFIALLCVAALVFAWGYYDEVHAHFHVLMLLFMSAMIGFCLTHDLFNLFVWFEVMGVAAFALTGYQLRTDALEGAMNFTLLNGIGSYLFLMGLGIVYARVGALDFSALERGVAEHPHDVLVLAAFLLLASGFLFKAAQVPFHFWLPDAHAVAPSPVSVIFSGVMVALGVVGIAKLFWSIFAPSPDVHSLIQTALRAMGAISTLLGGFLALCQRHIKRLLAFSTISHTGILLLGFSLLSGESTAGMFLYLSGHGLVKAGLFMIAGILLSVCGGIDELRLRGLGRPLWPAGLLMALGGLLLAGLPTGLMGIGNQLIHQAAVSAGSPWIPGVIFIGAACTGAAVLRVTGRVFWGLGAEAGLEANAPTDDDREKVDRPVWLMLLPAALLIVIGAFPMPHTLFPTIQQATDTFLDPNNEAVLAVDQPQVPVPTSNIHAGPPDVVAWISVAAAVGLAALALSRRHVSQRVLQRLDAGAAPLQVLQRLHDGTIGEYVAWATAGLAAMTLVSAWRFF